MDQITFFRQFMVALHAHIRGATSSSGLFPPQPIPLPDVWPPCPILTIRISPNHFQTNKHAGRPGALNHRPTECAFIDYRDRWRGRCRPSSVGKKNSGIITTALFNGPSPLPLPLIGGGRLSSRSPPPGPHHYPPYTPGTGPSFALTLNVWHCPWLFLRPYLKPLALAPALTVTSPHTLALPLSSPSNCRETPCIPQEPTAARL